MHQNRLALSLYLPSLIYAVCQSMLRPVLPLYASAFDVSYGLIGLLLAGQGIGFLIADIPAGMLLRRFGTKQVMIVGIVGVALSTVALFGAATLPQAVLMRVVGGMCGALYNVSRHTYISNVIETGNRGRGIAMLGGVFRAGRFIGPALGAFIAGIFGLRVPFLVVGAAFVFALIVVIRFMPRLPVPEASHDIHILDTIRDNWHSFSSAGMGQIFVQMIRAGREAIVPLYAADVLGLEVEAIGLLQSIESALDVLMFYPTGIIMDRFGRKFAIVPSFTLQTIGMILLPFTTSFAGMALVVGMMGFANGLSAGTMMTLGSDLAPPGSRGEFLGVWRLIGDAGASGGPLVVGWIAAPLSLQAAALVIAGTGAFATYTFAFRVPETLDKP